MKNHTLKYYVQRNLNYTTLQHIKGEPEYAGKRLEINEMTYEDVKSVMRYLGKVQSWDIIKDIFETCFKINEEEFWQGKIVDFFKARNYIIQEFTNLLNLEKKLLTSIQTIDEMLWQEAGGDRLNKFSDIMPLMQLGEVYSLYPFDLKDKKYQEILLILTAIKERNEVNRAYDKLKSSVNV